MTNGRGSAAQLCRKARLVCSNKYFKCVLIVAQATTKQRQQLQQEAAATTMAARLK